MTLLDRIKLDTQKETAAAKKKRPFRELEKLIERAPVPKGFTKALAGNFGLIAEIKIKSPSVGLMIPENVARAVDLYEQSACVKAISILTNKTHFGMDIEDLGKLRLKITKPILRKDFIFDEYQVYEARAFGADAILLMACLLDKVKLKRLFRVATKLGMDVLFESHNQEEIKKLPNKAEVCGLNSRKFATKTTSFFSWAKWSPRVSKLGWWGKSATATDLSTDLGVFAALVSSLPPSAIKVAESGIKPDRIKSLKDLQFDAALIGTSLLTAREGIDQMLSRFEREIEGEQTSFVRSSDSPSIASHESSRAPVPV